MNADHARLLAELRAEARPVRGGPPQNDSYGGSGRPYFNVAVPVRRVMVRRWLREERPTAERALTLVESLLGGASHEERSLAALVLAAHAKARRQAAPEAVERWLGELEGWAEVDCLCAGAFPAAEILAGWDAWSDVIRALAASDDIDRRRGALVLLTAPARTSADPRVASLAFEIVRRLMPERPILITKAVSWLLRSLAMTRPAEMAAFLDANAARLPAIAVRETRAKLATGTKSGRSRRKP